MKIQQFPKSVPPRSRVAGLLDHVADQPPEAKFALASAEGQPLLVGMKLSQASLAFLSTSSTGLSPPAGQAAPKDAAIEDPRGPITVANPAVRRVLGQANKAGAVFGLLGENADSFAKAFPGTEAHCVAAGEIIDGCVIMTSGLGMIDALTKGDNKALAGCSMTLGASALGLAGKITGDVVLQQIALALKVSNSGWTIYKVIAGEPA